MAIPLFGEICAASNIIPAGVGVVRFKRLSKPMRFLAVLTVLACVQMVASALAGLWKHTNIFLDDYYALVEFCILWTVYFFSIRRRNSRLLLVVLGVMYLAAWLIKVPFYDGPIPIGGSMAVIDRIVLIVLSLVVAQEVLSGEATQILEKPVFWVVMGVVLYATGTIMVFGFSDRLLKSGLPYFEMAWRINWTLLIAANLFYTKALMCNPSK
jgi:hypothetical protein